MGKVCIFVDGENLRHSIVDLFRGEFDKHDYLPKDANWEVSSIGWLNKRPGTTARECAHTGMLLKKSIFHRGA